MHGFLKASSFPRPSGEKSLSKVGNDLVHRKWHMPIGSVYGVFLHKGRFRISRELYEQALREVGEQAE